MTVEENIAKLDALVKIIAPGIFALTVAMVLLEVVVLMFRKVQMNHKGGAVSLISGVGVFGFEAVADFLFYLALSYWMYNHRIFELGFEWYVWVACFMLFDFIFYWSHRIQHEVRLLWCFHSPHHSTPEMRLSSAVRGSVFAGCVRWVFIRLCSLPFALSLGCGECSNMCTNHSWVITPGSTKFLLRPMCIACIMEQTFNT
ncbi:MAG: sterol desaturase family protein [Bacteroidetes bacterium]|nr:sterol desaturase family protein [Bacteroidota bacterium]